ncbi:hypothetical protein V8E52_008671, partial [Russula decolorans]
LLDREHRVIGVLVGRPRESDKWGAVCDDAVATLQTAADDLGFTAKEKGGGRCGHFPTIAHGLSFGGGQQVPGFLRHSPKRERVLRELMGRRSIQCICNFASSMYVQLCLACIYMTCLESFEAHGRKNYNYMKATAGAFPCRSFNLGQQTASFPHLDEKNLAQSWCSITLLGDFSPDLGGHLVLWDFGLIVHFPAGSTALIPSALLVHSNTPIQLGETRRSIVQYAARGLFRWVRSGLVLEKDRLACASKGDLQGDQVEKELQWKAAVEMYTKLNEL